MYGSKNETLQGAMAAGRGSYTTEGPSTTRAEGLGASLAALEKSIATHREALGEVFMVLENAGLLQPMPPSAGDTASDRMPTPGRVSYRVQCAADEVNNLTQGLRVLARQIDV